MAIYKKIPDDEEGFDLMLDNMAAKIEDYKTKLEIPAAKITMVQEYAVSYHGWRVLKNRFSETKTSITNVVKQLFAGDPNEVLPAAPNLDFTAPPMPAKPGIEKQIEKLIGDLERHENFTDAIGLDLGFYVETSGTGETENLVGDFEVKDFMNYTLDVSFSKQGQDALDLRWRIKGTIPFTTVRLTSSPYRLQIPPDASGNAVTVEMQGVLIDKNEPVGQASDLKTVIAHA